MSYVRNTTNDPRYLPTLEEIEAATDAIREGWTPEERETRWLLAHSICNINDIPSSERRWWKPRRSQRRSPRWLCVDFSVG